MARNSVRTAGIAGMVAWALVVASGCASGTESPSEPSATSSETSASSEPSGTATPAPSGVGVSPGGVTTAVGAPAESTEDDYFQSCRAARTWMEQRGGDPHSQIEPYLGTVQHADSVGPGTFDKRWSELTPGQQSAVIVAVQAAADALCG